MIEKYYPETGKLSRHNYPKHCLFFEAGKTHRERCMMAANRVGKTDAACFEVTCHLTGQYPDWWIGRKFDRPLDVWLSGDTGTTVRDILQKKLFGDYHEVGTGFIRSDRILKTTNKSGVREAIDTAVIRHDTNGRFDGHSTVVLKSYDQGRKSFQGGKPDIILLDEEPPQDVYTECVLRTMTNDGMIIMTFTPLMGMTELIYTYMDPEKEMVH
jgi:phage terminase large subunit-like protein